MSVRDLCDDNEAVSDVINTRFHWGLAGEPDAEKGDGTLLALARNVVRIWIITYAQPGDSRKTLLGKIFEIDSEIP
jgi:hypothetical protein